MIYIVSGIEMAAQQKQDDDNGDEFVVWNADGMWF